MVVNGKPLKRMKKRVTADLYNFLTFPATENGCSDQFQGPFRCNVRSFLTKHGRLSTPCSLFPHLLIWQILFRIGELVDGNESLPAVVYLDVIEEDVTRSRSIYCDQCRVVGWSGHPVCGKRYHFIIQRDSSSFEHQRLCIRCGDLLHVTDSRCKSCNYMMTADDLEDWLHCQLEDNTHLLHGVVHTNGFGHLLRVNGREGGSKFLLGSDIMNFWDRLCRTLGVRKVSVMDISKKYGLDYRILHAVTNGHPWYGDWGFEFGAGSFALTVDAYRRAVDTLSNMPLSHFLQARKPRSQLQDVITFYQSMSECELGTIKDLFGFLMRLIHEAHNNSSTFGVQKKSGSCSWALCTWTREDIERVEQSIIKVLLAVGGSCWVSWRALKGALCRVASPELINHCLRELGGKSVANGMFVLSQCNRNTNTIEYRLDSRNVISGDIHGDHTFPSFESRPSESHLLQDLKFLYDALLNPQTMLNYSSGITKEMVEHAASAASKLLDCKQFVKEYKLEQIDANSSGIQLLIHAELADQPIGFTSPPPEIIVLPPDATVADLKMEAAEALQDVYVLFKRFQVEELPGFNHIDEKAQIKFLVGSDGTVRIRGKCNGMYGLDRFRMERGTESWIVNCACGAKDDDGERMLACDSCGTWQHTRCAGIPDLDLVPERFLCWKCETAAMRANIQLETGKQVKSGTDEAGAKIFKRRGKNSKSSKRCKAQVPDYTPNYVHVPSCYSETCEMGSVETVFEACSSRKRTYEDFETDGKCRGVVLTLVSSDRMEYIEGESKDEGASVSDTSTISDQVEENSAFENACYFVKTPNSYSDGVWQCKNENLAAADACMLESGLTMSIVRCG